MSAVRTPAGTFQTVIGDTVRAQALAILPILDPNLRAGAGQRAITVAAQDPRVRAHVVDGALVLTGRPELAVPGLAMTGGTLHVQVQGAGLAAQDVTVDIPAGTALPFDGPAVLLDVPAIALAASVTASAFPHAPIAGAQTTVAGTVPDGSVLALRSPLAVPHDTGTPIRSVALNPAGSTTLVNPAPAGATQLGLASTAGMSSGAVLAVGAEPTVEHVVVAAVLGSQIRLRLPLVGTRAAATAVAVVAVGAPTATTTLTRPAAAGDSVLVVAAAISSTAVSVADADPDRVEHRVTGCRSDTDGRWRLAGIRGVPSVTLTTSAAGFVTAGPSEYPLDGLRDPNVIDIALDT